MKINFAEIHGNEPIPAGTYLATVVEAKAGKSTTDNPKIDVQWKIEGGEFANRRVFDTISFHEKSLARTKTVLMAMGLPKTFNGEVTEIAEQITGVTANITVSIDVSDKVDPETGETYPDRNRIKKVAKVGGTAAQPAQGRGLFKRG